MNSAAIEDGRREVADGGATMHRPLRPFLIVIAVAMLVLATASRIYRLMPVLFSRSLSFNRMEAANSRQSLETIMTHALQLPYQSGAPRLFTAIRALGSAVAAEHTRALRAATKAARPRQNLTELRALYARPLDPNR